MTLADILRDRMAAQTKRQPTIGAATGPDYFGSVDPLTEYGGAVEESYNPLEDLAPVGGLRRLLGLGGAALGFGTIPAWKLTKNAPSWFQRAFKGGKREVPLQGRTPKRLAPEKVLEPEVVSTPSDEIPGNLLKQLGLPTRLEDATPGTPIHEALYWQRAMGGSEGPTAARRLGRSEAGGLVKKPVTYEIPESNAGLKQLLEQEGGAYTGLGGEEGTTRLYRGESPGPTDAPKRAKRHSGEWFTPSKEKAQEFQSFYDKGRLKFVDVPQGELEQLNELVTRAFGKMNRVPDDEYLIPREIQDKLWTRFLKEQPEGFGKRKPLPVSGGAPSMFEKSKGRFGTGLTRIVPKASSSALTAPFERSPRWLDRLRSMIPADMPGESVKTWAQNLVNSSGTADYLGSADTPLELLKRVPKHQEMLLDSLLGDKTHLNNPATREMLSGASLADLHPADYYAMFRKLLSPYTTPMMGP